MILIDWVSWSLVELIEGSIVTQSKDVFASDGVHTYVITQSDWT
jgi:hypothetical protein